MPTYNLGQQYEEKIRNLLKARNLLPLNLHGNDAGFVHIGKEYYLEVKNDKAPDFGQKGLIWSEENGWEWRERDIMTELYDQIGVIDQINNDFIPRRYTVPQAYITPEDKKFDQQQVKKSNIAIDEISYLFEYYARKKCHYIQMEGMGFYYLKQDIANLEVPQFLPQLALRIRAKTHHTNPTYAYSFFVVINIKPKSIKKSRFDLEEKVGKFPSIK